MRDALTIGLTLSILNPMKASLPTMGLLGGFLLLAGCETEPASSSIRVTPSAVALRIGESVEFVASGGYDYRWSLGSDENQSLGILSTLRGDRTTYISLATPPNSNAVTRVLTVTSSLPNTAGGTGTNAATTVSAWTDQAHITHL